VKKAFIIIAILVGFYFFVGRHIYERVSAEVKYRHKYGADWKEHYSADRHVTVGEDHQKLVVAGGSVALVGMLAYGIYREAIPRRTGRRRSGKRRSHSPPIPS
jgi:hypothetical protein